MAAKSQRGSLKDPFTSEGKPYFFDVGVADEIAVCYSCHTGGGPAEGIVQEDGTVIPYDDPSLAPTHSYDRDFYSYPPTANTMALLSQQPIEETIKAIGDPEPHDWTKSGVMEADCLICHIDPESPYALHAADGLKAQAFRPRLMIFANRDADGKVTEISLGMPLTTGLANQTALNYTDPAQRMGRPTALLALMQLPKENVGEMMQMWVDGLKAIEASGIRLPYALYGQNVQKIWGPQGIRAEYCLNPNGPADEMQRLQNAGPALNQLFEGFLQYMKMNGFLPGDATMEDMMNMFFNDFIYGYGIKMNLGPVPPEQEQMMPMPYPLRAYEPGKFYTSFDNPQASVRDFMRAPFVEGEGIPYSGMVGMGWGATMYGMQLAMQGDFTYIDPATGSIDASKILADMQSGAIPPDAVKPALHEALPYFFGIMPTAQLMGLDFNQDGAPVTYVKMEKVDGQWQAKTYYNTSDIPDGSLNMDMFGASSDIDSWKWVRVCGQCHVMYEDENNSHWQYVRPFGLGMPADWVKNGAFVNFTDDEEASGYDVHMSGRKMGCGSCHLRYSGSIEDKHNILKGTDTAHMVRNDLDNNPKPRTCESCHLYGDDINAPNPAYAHEEKFGENTGRHIAAIACQTCHVPYRRTWRFRTFNDLFGYFLNFDNGFGYNVLPGGDGKAMAFPGQYRIPPVYGTSPGYGLGQLNMLAQHIDADGSGNVVPMDYVSEMAAYFEMNKEADPGHLVNGLPTNPKFDFMKYFYQMSLDQMQAMGVPIEYDPEHDLESEPPLYWANGANGYPQIVIGNPITIMTWVDVNPQPDHDMSDIAYGGAKVLYIREMNAAIQAFLPRVAVTPIDPATLASIPPNDPGWAQNPNVAKIILRDSGYVMFDHTGDGFPDLWWKEDVAAMQEALVKVLKAEGEADPKPVVFVAAHYFSDSHGVQPKEKALGAQSCYDCHGDYTKDPGAHRITDKIVTYVPWNPPWFTEDNRFLRYAPDEVSPDAPIWMRRGGYVVNNPEGQFVVDGEVAYIAPQQANGLNFLGAKAEDVLALSKHHAEELFYMVAEGSVSGEEIEGIDHSLLSPEELETTYVKQVVNSPAGQVMNFYVPDHMKGEIAEMGFLPTEELIYVSGSGMFPAFVAAVGINGGMNEACIIRLPFQGGAPAIVSKDAGSTSFFMDNSAVVLGHSGPYLLVKVTHNGEYAAVERAAATSGINGALWNAFMEQ